MKATPRLQAPARAEVEEVEEMEEVEEVKEVESTK